MSESTLDDLPNLGPGQFPLPAHPLIQDIVTWVGKFSMMVSVLTSRFPEEASEFFAYQVSIVQAERNFGKNLKWSVPNHGLYNGVFTGLILGPLRGVPTSSRTTTPCSRARANKIVCGS